MSSISLSLKMLLAGSALAGLTLLACGGDDGGSKASSDDDDVTTGKKDGGTTKKDGGTTTVKKDAGLPFATGAVEGEECEPPGGMCDSDACDSPPCVATCDDGVYSACKPLTGLIGGDGGFKLPDSGITRNGDGGFDITIGDATVPLPTNDCPSSLMCSTSLAQYGFPAICAGASPLPGVIPDVPPSCTTTADCNQMGLTAAVCQEIGPLGMLCLAACKP